MVAHKFCILFSTCIVIVLLNLSFSQMKKLLLLLLAHLSRSIRGMKFKLSEMFRTLASANIVFLLPLLMCFRCYGNLKFPLIYN